MSLTQIDSLENIVNKFSFKIFKRKIATFIEPFIQKRFSHVAMLFVLKSLLGK